MFRRFVLSLLVLVTLCFFNGCKFKNEGWSGNITQTIGITGTYEIIDQSGCQVYQSFTFTQIENVVEAVDNLGNRYDGWATQDLVIAENDPAKEGDLTYYLRTISISISGTLKTGQTVTLILTPLYGSSSGYGPGLGEYDTGEILLPHVLEGTFSDDTGCAGYISMENRYPMDVVTSA